MSIPFLLPPDVTLLAAYKELTAEIDQQITDLTRQRFSAFLQCRPGCSDCCIAFSVLPVEAAILRDALSRMQGPVLTPSEGNSCVFLQGNCFCSLYDRRPLLCRTQGMALAYLDEESQSIEVSACRINFPEGFAFAQDDLLFMDSFNDRLAVLNIQYCRQAGLQPDCRIALSDILSSLR